MVMPDDELVRRGTLDTSEVLSSMAHSVHFNLMMMMMMMMMI